MTTGSAYNRFHGRAVAGNDDTELLQKLIPHEIANDVTHDITRAKRQTYYYYYYLCGTYPTQYYSYTPCTSSSANSYQCSNGGSKVGYGCSSTSECATYYNGLSVCLQNCCCTVPGK
uniref:Uncharacterized protein n=1 Tax=Plectus sambesii TaxID=2011161 RepID=A0A914VNC6_9BILA